MSTRETYLTETHVYQGSMSIRETYRWHTSLERSYLCASQRACSWAGIGRDVSGQVMSAGKFQGQVISIFGY